jgi:hypothetical protein
MRRGRDPSKVLPEKISTESSKTITRRIETNKAINKES